jgi:hypothetical protein
MYEQHKIDMLPDDVKELLDVIKFLETHCSAAHQEINQRYNEDRV